MSRLQEGEHLYVFSFMLSGQIEIVAEDEDEAQRLFTDQIEALDINADLETGSLDSIDGQSLYFPTPKESR